MNGVDKYKQFVLNLKNTLKNKNYDNVIFLCIGTDRITGDCFGPIVGSILINKQNVYKMPNVKIIGSLENNLSFDKINNNTINIIKKYKNPIIISIDAALSNQNNIGSIFIKNSGI